MRQAIFVAPGDLQLQEAPVPNPGPAELLVRVRASGVCGSDRAFFAGTAPIRTPIVLGHEFAGEVVGLGLHAEEFEVGDRVSVDPNVTCGQCVFCHRGLVSFCQRLSPLGIERPGGYAEFSVVPVRNAYKLAEHISFDEAALAEPLACCVRGIEQANVQLGDVVVILGVGPIGLLLVQLARLRGASLVVVSEPSATRREVALGLGADVAVRGDELAETILTLTGGVGADIAIEAAGQTSAARQALTVIRSGGTVVWFGVCPQADEVAVRPHEINEREMTVRGSNINPFTHQTALTLIERGRVSVKELISDRIQLDDLPVAIDPRKAAFSGKVILNPGAGE